MKISSILRGVAGLTITAALAFMANPASATVQTGDIAGRVLGAATTGTAGTMTTAPLGGVKITVTGPSMIGAREGVTDAEGRYHIVAIPPGSYVVTFSATGYVDKPVPTNVTLDRQQQLDVTLTPPEAGGITMNVEAIKPTIDVTQTQGGEVVSKDFMTKLPVDQDYLSVARMVPGVIGTGNSSVNGAATSENMFLVDGVNITDPVTNTFSANFNFESIDQVEVLTGGFDPEHQALGGVINAITKSGGNDFHGAVVFDYHDDLGLGIPGTKSYLFKSPRRKHRCARYNDGYTPTGDDIYDQDHCQDIIEFSEFGTISQNYSTNFSLGGPILRDKVWFFASMEHFERFDKTAGVAAPLNVNFDAFQAKFTYQPATRHKLTLSMQSDPTLFTKIVQSPYTPTEAEAQQAQGGLLLSTEHQWFVTDKFVVRNSLTYHHQYLDFGPFAGSKLTGRFNLDVLNPPLGDLTTPGRAGILGADSSVNFTNYSLNRRERYQYSPKLTYYLDNAAGNHEISAGLDIALIREDIIGGTPGNVTYIDRRLTPFDSGSATVNYYYIEQSAPLRQKASGLQSALYVQDAWKPIDKLTVRGGFRFDRGGLYNDAGSEVISFFAVSPRIYAAYDLTGDGKTVIRGGYGRFIDPTKLEQSDFLNRHGQDAKLILNGNLFGTPQGVGSEYLGVSGEATTLRAAKVTVPRQDAIRLGAERDVTHGVAVGLTWNAKWTNRLFEDDEANLIWNGNGTEVVGTRIGVVDNRFRIRTPGSARRYYQDMEFTIRRRFADQLEMLGSYTWSRSLGTTPAQYSAALDVPPQDKFDFGYLPNDHTNVFRLSASYDFNFGLTFGTAVNYVDGARYEKHTLNDFSGGYSNRTAPRGHGGQIAGAPLWDVKLTYGPKLPGAWGKVKGQFQVLNVLNNRQIAAYSQGVYDSRGLLYPAARQEPLSTTLGLRYDF